MPSPAVLRVPESAPVRRGLPIFVVAAAVLLTTAGCGGTKTYKEAKTRACLAQQAGVHIGRKVDFVASTALGGAFAVRLSSNQVTISFGLDQPEADRLAGAYRQFRGKNIGIEDVLRPERNAVLLWKAHPSDEDLSLVTRCLN